MYNRTKWLDKVVDADTGELIQEGTDQSAGNFNNMENGISDNHTAAAMLLIAAGQIIAEQAVEEITVQLTNSASYLPENCQHGNHKNNHRLHGGGRRHGTRRRSWPHFYRRQAAERLQGKI